MTHSRSRAARRCRPGSARTRACRAPDRARRAWRGRRSGGSRAGTGPRAGTRCARPCSAPPTGCSRTSASSWASRGARVSADTVPVTARRTARRRRVDRDRGVGLGAERGASWPATSSRSKRGRSKRSRTRGARNGRPSTRPRPRSPTRRARWRRGSSPTARPCSTRSRATRELDPGAPSREGAPTHRLPLALKQRRQMTDRRRCANGRSGQRVIGRDVEVGTYRGANRSRACHAAAVVSPAGAGNGCRSARFSGRPVLGRLFVSLGRFEDGAWRRSFAGLTRPGTR